MRCGVGVGGGNGERCDMVAFLQRAEGDGQHVAAAEKEKRCGNRCVEGIRAVSRRGGDAVQKGKDGAGWRHGTRFVVGVVCQPLLPFCHGYLDICSQGICSRGS